MRAVLPRFLPSPSFGRAPRVSHDRRSSGNQVGPAVRTLGAVAAWALLIGTSLPAAAEPASQTGQTAQWTVLVYMAADNDLEANALRNLQQMAAVGSTTDVQVVVQADRPSGGDRGQGVLNLPGWSGAKRLHVEPGSLTELDDLGPLDMTDPGTLQDFVSWGVQAYPAQHYALVLWDHGDDWLGFGVDQSAGGTSHLALPALADALQASGTTFDLLGFDACLMASAETALTLQSTAHVLVASEESEPALGWDYATVLSGLEAQPDLDARGLGALVAGSYQADLRKRAPQEALYATMSVVDLDQMPAVGDALDRFTGAVLQYVTPGGSTAGVLDRLGQVLGKARSETPSFGRTDFLDPGRGFDLRLLSAHTAEVTGDPAIGQAAGDLRAALDQAVVYQTNGDGYQTTGLGGLSLFVPASTTTSRESQESYGALPGVLAHWGVAIRAFVDATTGDTQKPHVSPLQADTLLVVPGQKAATITGEVQDETLVTGAMAGVLRSDGQQLLLVSFTELPRTYAKSNPIRYVFDGLGWFIDDGSGRQPVFAVQWRQGQHAVFGTYQAGPQSRPTRAYAVFDDTSGAMIEAFETVGGAMGAIQPSASARFVPYQYTLDLQAIPGSPISLATATVKQAPLPDGGYMVSATGFDLGDNADSNAMLVVVKSAGASGASPSTRP